MVGAGSWRDLADHAFSPHRERSHVERDRFCGRRTRTLADHSLCRNHARRSGETLSANPGLEPKEIDCFCNLNLESGTEQDGHRFAERLKVTPVRSGVASRGTSRYGSYRQRTRWNVDTKTARGDVQTGKCEKACYGICSRCNIYEPIDQLRTWVLFGCSTGYLPDG